MLSGEGDDVGLSPTEIEHRLTALETKFWIILLLLLGNFGLGVLNLVSGR